MIVCGNCRKHVSVATGTIFEKSKVPLKVWCYAIWQIASNREGISATTLHKFLPVKRFETSWRIHKNIRSLMATDETVLLRGKVELDEAYIGTRHDWILAPKLHKQTTVVIGVEVKKRGVGKIRIGVVEENSGESLRNFIEHSVEPSSTICTDAWNGYRTIIVEKYNHIESDPIATENSFYVRMTKVRKIAEDLQKWWLDVYKGAIDPANLDSYLNEYTYRFNNRRKSKGKVFEDLLKRALAVSM